MFPSKDYSSPQETCQDVLQTLRSSDLIFLVQESPYSAYVTIRKRFRKDSQPKNQSFQQKSFTVSEVEILRKQLDNLQISNYTLSNYTKNLEAKYEEIVVECEELNKRVIGNEELVETLHLKLEKAEAENCENQKMKTFQTINEKLIAENKILKNEKDDH